MDKAELRLEAFRLGGTDIMVAARSWLDSKLKLKNDDIPGFEDTGLMREVMSVVPFTPMRTSRKPRLSWIALGRVVCEANEGAVSRVG